MSKEYSKEDLKRDIRILSRVDDSAENVLTCSADLTIWYNRLFGDDPVVKYDRNGVIKKIESYLNEMDKQANRIHQYVEELRAFSLKEEFDG